MTIQVSVDRKGIATMVMDRADKAVNLLDRALTQDLAEALTQLAREQGLRGIILTSAKEDFVSGADIEELFQLAEAEYVMALGARVKVIFRKLETLGVPVVAAMNGNAFGGGYELALACHHRVLLNHSDIRVSFPEVKLGLFPGGGGSQRLPRLLGIRAAVPILLEGRRYTPDQAFELGLVDALAQNREDLLAQSCAWITGHADASQPWDRERFRWRGGDPHSPKMMQWWAVAPSLLNQKARGCYPALRNGLAAVHEGSLVDFDTAARIETRYFAKTALSKEAKNMITAFWHQLNRVKKGASRPRNQPRVHTEKVGILGAGMMGSGIAHVTALAGMAVVLKDVTRERAEKGKAYSQGILEKMTVRGKISTEERDRCLNSILATADLEPLNGCDLVIEAVFEDRQLKERVISEVEKRLSPDAVFASNTSTLPITSLATASQRPDHFIGLHFFSPVDKMKLVEIIVGKLTGPQTLAKAFDFVLAIGKIPIVVNDSRGFFTSRVFSTYLQEGMALLAEGQLPRAIESAGLQGGMPVGPLAISDEVSLSLIHQIRRQTRQDMEKAGLKYKAHPADEVIGHMVETLQRPGKRAGHGFYEYPQDGAKYLWPGLTGQYRPASQPLAQEEMVARLLFIQSIETVRCLQEGVVNTVADANLGSILGWGFAPFKGGVLQYINDYGVKAFAERAQILASRHGSRFQPPDLLMAKAAKGENFADPHLE